jgi:protein O-GlcNAc transferase
MSQGKRKEAVEHFIQTVRFDPDHADTHNNLSMALVGAGQTNEAIIHYTEALRIHPGFAKPITILGMFWRIWEIVKEPLNSIARRWW